MAESPCARIPRRHIPGKQFIVYLQKNIVNLSNFIYIFRYYYFHYASIPASSDQQPGPRAPRRLRSPKKRRPTGGLASLPDADEIPMTGNAGKCGSWSQAMFEL